MLAAYDPEEATVALIDWLCNHNSYSMLNTKCFIQKTVDNFDPTSVNYSSRIAVPRKVGPIGDEIHGPNLQDVMRLSQLYNKNNPKILWSS